MYSVALKESLIMRQQRSELVLKIKFMIIVVVVIQTRPDRLILNI